MGDLNIKSKLKLLIAYHVGEVLDLLLASYSGTPDFTNELILLIARYNDLQRDAQQKRIDRQNVLVEMNHLRLSIMEFIDQAGPQELNLERIRTQLLEEENFQRILELKITKDSFIGMRREEEIVRESLEFKWASFFAIGSDGTVHHRESLLSAIHLLQLRYQLTARTQRELSGAAFFNYLLTASRQLRELSGIADVNWIYSESYLQQQLPISREMVLAFTHETVEKLL
ncbi:hypothetical protein [Flavilitoribacter nigricans]|uniref:Effector-associated domain-containing protein n=1 Tax=Flavilitoribacter nigricans (strain ATCC 23147 / DSM 23189 / NBRC 102662 / NCIMB 1420 / SS-2) TaxID=1122177 RepID=A0A2D0N1G7_FLAN2|nr:hypothetical protein [Flavilitoribacter nigricans]PHN01979.1 hypothetical protein CRP01_34300 [Flavilitoribacter nigricans DSM 23189 = NBRC 102662]